jgi:autotransporter strand-loop-strand O-heptosyltransferase
LLKERGIPYVFSHHDHHAHYLGKDSEVYRQNLEAIKGSVLSFVHAKYLIDYFESLPQLRYLSHGANLDDYYFEDRSKDLINNGPRLVMMANNGLLGDPFFDRKGFIPGIECASILGLPITIICPSKNNKEFFEKNKDVASYQNLNVIYDMNYEDSLAEMRKHHVFLNPGAIEAGHPNLTVTESIAMGIPVVGLMEADLKGMRRIETANTTDLVNGVGDALLKYSQYVLECKEQRSLISWEVVVSRMLMDYAAFGGISQKDLILNDYRSIPKRIEKREDHGFYSWFKRDPHFYKCSYPDGEGQAIFFRDARTGSIKSFLNVGKSKRAWTTVPDDRTEYIDWEIVIKDGSEVLKSIKMDLTDQHVLIEDGNIRRDDIKDIVKDFVSSTNCIPSISEKSKFLEDIYIPHFKYDGNDESGFYRVLNTDQIISFFSPNYVKENNPLIILKTSALGDTISFIPYADEYARRAGIKCDVVSNFGFLYTGIYSNVNIIAMPGDLSSYTDIICCDYIYDLPLQLGFAKQLGLGDMGKIRPQLKKSDKPSPLNKKYVCFSSHSTAQAKHWNNNNSWEKLCDMLTKKGLIPVCIDRYYSFGNEGNWNEIPKNCMNKTGMELTEMMHWIEHCEFFVGLSSGLSWVAHALDKKVVVISGVTTKDNEFDEDCIRIHREDLCNSCFNSPERFPFNPGDWFWCPEHKGTPRQFECTKRISAKQVMDAIDARGWSKIK